LNLPHEEFVLIYFYKVEYTHTVFSCITMFSMGLTSDVYVGSHILSFFFHGKYNMIIRTIEENNLEYKYERLLFFTIYWMSVSFFFLRKRIKVSDEANGVTEERFLRLEKLFLNGLQMYFLFLVIVEITIHSLDYPDQKQTFLIACLFRLIDIRKEEKKSENIFIIEHLSYTCKLLRYNKNRN